MITNANSVHDEQIFQLAGIDKLRAFPLVFHASYLRSDPLYFSWRQRLRFCLVDMGAYKTSLAKPAYYFRICLFRALNLPSLFH